MATGELSARRLFFFANLLFQHSYHDKHRVDATLTNGWSTIKSVSACTSHCRWKAHTQPTRSSHRHEGGHACPPQRAARSHRAWREPLFWFVLCLSAWSRSRIVNRACSSVGRRPQAPLLCLDGLFTSNVKVIAVAIYMRYHQPSP